MIAPELDRWIASPSLHVRARRRADADPATLWSAAQRVALAETGLLGRLIRWRIPGTPPSLSFGEFFRRAPFVVLEEREHALVSGLVGPIWTLRRDYPQLRCAAEFEDFHRVGTARVTFAHWVAPDGVGAWICADVRVEAVGLGGALGVAAVRPLVRSFGGLVGSEGLMAAVRAAELS
jgi:hypothetical protein